MSDDLQPMWVLLGLRKGDNAQLLALADALNVPYRRVQLDYNLLSLLLPRFLGASTVSLKREARAGFRPPWPDLVLGIGYRGVPAARAIFKRSKGRTKLVRLGNPRLDPRHFDLVITTPQYAVPDAPNVVQLPIAIPAGPSEVPTANERQWLDELPRPHRLLIVGGPTFMWTLDAKTIVEAVEQLRSKDGGGSMIGVSSPRTPRQISAVLADLLGPQFVDGAGPRYQVLLQDADEIFVTDDSVSMVSEAIMTGKPVGLVPTRRTRLGTLLYAFAGLTRTRVPVRDLSRFRLEVERQKLAGSVAAPVAARSKPQPLETALAAVRKIDTGPA